MNNPGTTQTAGLANPFLTRILIKALRSTAILAFVVPAQIALAVDASMTVPAPAAGFEPMTFVNYETPHVRPMALTPDRQRLLVVNTADNALLVFDVGSGNPVLANTIPVGVEPVSVNARTNSEAWVVNHLSDTVSVIDLTRGIVIDTIATDDEPADVVFAGMPQRAFVTASQVNRVNVFDPLSRQTPGRSVVIAGEDPRMLAVSADGQTVYAAIFESGNGTTTMAGGKSLPRIDDVVANPLSPYLGNTTIPNRGPVFEPPMNAANPQPPPVSIIVRKQDDNRWLDDRGGDWSRFAGGDLSHLADRVRGWDLPDRDVAIIDANSLRVTYQTRLMNIVMAIAVNPRTQAVTVVGTDATNEIRFEPVLNGKFLRVNYASFSGSNARTITDLNAHLDYRQSSVAKSIRDLSIGDPRSIAWRGNGMEALVSGMGSNNVLVINDLGRVLRRIQVGQGPTGIVINDTANRAFVLNRFDASISVIDLGTNQVTNTARFFDPTPQAVIAGRPFLYNTHLTSGLGHVACGSCHVDARTDRLAWDLGNPAGAMETRVDNTGRTWTFHPMKGPMKTQTLQDIIGSPSLHHRGDKDDIFGFASAFSGLQGTDAPLDRSSMTLLEAYLDSIHYPPNPNRNIDNSFSSAVSIQGPSSGVQSVGNAQAGFSSMLATNRCISCHTGARGRSDTLGENGLHDGQPAIAEPFGGFYDRMGFFWADAQGSTSGFGFRTDGTQDSTFREEGTTRDQLAAFLSWEGPKPSMGGLSRDSHAGVGQQVQLGLNTDQRARELIRIADSGNIGLVVHGTYQGTRQGFAYTGSDRFQADTVLANVSYSDLLRATGAGDTLVLTLVARGTEYRAALDSDLDGLLNQDDPQPRSAGATTWAGCATEGQTCGFNGTTVVRYGAQGHWLYGVFTGSASCSNRQFGDPLEGTLKTCQYLPGSAPVLRGLPSDTVLCAREGGVCSIPTGTRVDVFYGAGNSWYSLTPGAASIACNNAQFGDPARGIVKTCRYLRAGSLPSNTVACATENAICTIPAGTSATVYYGAGDTWVSIPAVSGSIGCNNNRFGDPLSGVVKACRYVR